MMHQAISWPVTIAALLGPAVGNINQYEFQIPSLNLINSKLPLITGNPYIVTSSLKKTQRNPGISIICEYSDFQVIGQFHRSPNDGRGIWLGSNNRGPSGKGIQATYQWRGFIKHLGITVGHDDTTIRVLLKFYASPLKVVISLL